MNHLNISNLSSTDQQILNDIHLLVQVSNDDQHYLLTKELDGVNRLASRTCLFHFIRLVLLKSETSDKPLTRKFWIGEMKMNRKDFLAFLHLLTVAEAVEGGASRHITKSPDQVLAILDDIYLDL